MSSHDYVMICDISECFSGNDRPRTTHTEPNHMSSAIAIILHLLAINIWVGGTFFSVVVLRHAVLHLEPEQQTRLMQWLLPRFFFWVWIAILVLLGSGGWMVYQTFGGLGTSPLYILVMLGFGVTMMLNFTLIFFEPYQHYKKAIAQHDINEAQRQLAMIGNLSKINMVLGICVVVAIGLGPHVFT